MGQKLSRNGQYKCKKMSTSPVSREIEIKTAAHCSLHQIETSKI